MQDPAQAIKPKTEYLPDDFRAKIRWSYEIAYGEIWGPESFYQEEEILPGISTYYQEFIKSLSKNIQAAQIEQVNAAIKNSDLVYVSDFHPLRLAKESFVSLMEESEDSREVIILLEAFGYRQNKLIDAYLAGKINSEEIRTKIGNKGAEKYSRQGILHILNYAKEKSIPVYGIDTKKGLSERDQFWARKHKRVWKQHPSSRIFTLVGEMHLGEEHLPAEISKLLPKIKSTTVYQGLTETFWPMLEKDLAADCDAIQMKDNVFCLNNCSPLLKALIYERIIDGARDPDFDYSGDEINRNYKHELNDLLKEALSLKTDSQDLGVINIVDLESLVYGNLEGKEALAKYKELFGIN
jgi:hypothetical protein